MYINLTDKIKVKSPLVLSNKYSYEGDIENIDFKHQKNNYKKLSESLQPFSLKFVHIYYAEFQTTPKSNIRAHFLASTENKEVYWRKYEAEAAGSGQNYIYFNGIRLKLTEWFSYDSEKQKEIIENYIPNLKNK